MGEKPAARRGRGEGLDTRERVMDVAEARLAEVGYLGVSLVEVARAVGVTKPALYYHFPGGKEQLFVELAHRALRRTREGMERAMSGPKDGAGKLREAARWLMSQRDGGQPLGEIKNVVDFVGEEHQGGLVEGFYGSLYGPIRRAVSSAVESGEFREGLDPDFLTWAFLGLASGMMDVDRVSSEGPTPQSVFASDKTADGLIDLFLKGALA